KRAYCLKTQPATGETYPKSDLFNKADEKPTYARMTAHLPNKNESYECLIKIQHELIRSEEK
ncbi:hypothetical protein RZR22_19445, partial [Escherichia coli]|nr:hypothetical protein [Escherichia coli]